MLPATVGPAENFAVCCAILRVKFATAMLPVTVLLAWACWEFCGLLRHLVVTACNCHVPCSCFLLQGASQIRKFFTHQHFQLISLPVSNLTLLSHSKAFKIKSQELGQRQDFCPPLKLSPQLQRRDLQAYLINVNQDIQRPIKHLKFLSLFPKRLTGSSANRSSSIPSWYLTDAQTEGITLSSISEPHSLHHGPHLMTYI